MRKEILYFITIFTALIYAVLLSVNMSDSTASSIESFTFALSFILPLVALTYIIIHVVSHRNIPRRLRLLFTIILCLIEIPRLSYLGYFAFLSLFKPIGMNIIVICLTWDIAMIIACICLWKIDFSTVWKYIASVGLAFKICRTRLLCVTSIVVFIVTALVDSAYSVCSWNIWLICLSLIGMNYLLYVFSKNKYIMEHPIYIGICVVVAFISGIMYIVQQLVFLFFIEGWYFYGNNYIEILCGNEWLYGLFCAEMIGSAYTLLPVIKSVK